MFTFKFAFLDQFVVFLYCSSHDLLVFSFSLYTVCFSKELRAQALVFPGGCQHVCVPFRAGCCAFIFPQVVGAPHPARLAVDSKLNFFLSLMLCCFLIFFLLFIDSSSRTWNGKITQLLTRI